MLGTSLGRNFVIDKKMIFSLAPYALSHFEISKGVGVGKNRLSL